MEHLDIQIPLVCMQVMIRHARYRHVTMGYVHMYYHDTHAHTRAHNKAFWKQFMPTNPDYGH